MKQTLPLLLLALASGLCSAQEQKADEKAATPKQWNTVVVHVEGMT